jgi:hypothetical protein
MQVAFSTNPTLLSPAVTRFNAVWNSYAIAGNQLAVSGVTAVPLNTTDGTNALATLLVTKQKPIFNSYSKTIALQDEVSVRKERIARKDLNAAVLKGTFVAAGGYPTVQAASITSASTGVLTPTQYTDLLTGLTYGGVWLDLTDITATAAQGLVTITALSTSLGWVGSVTVGLNPATAIQTPVAVPTARAALITRLNMWLNLLLVQPVNCLGYDVDIINDNGNNTALKLYTTQRAVAVRYVRGALNGTVDLTNVTSASGLLSTENPTLATVVAALNGTTPVSAMHAGWVAPFPGLAVTDLVASPPLVGVGAMLLVASPTSVNFTGSVTVLLQGPQ